MYGVLLSVLFLQSFIVAIAPFAARVGYLLVVAVSSGVATTIYPGPVLVVVAAVAGFAVALATPRRYYGIWVVVIVIAVALLPTTLAGMGACYFCKVVECDSYPVKSCGLGTGLLYVKTICECHGS
jgi:hypothetical protein